MKIILKKKFKAFSLILASTIVFSIMIPPNGAKAATFDYNTVKGATILHNASDIPSDATLVSSFDVSDSLQQAGFTVSDYDTAFPQYLKYTSDGTDYYLKRNTNYQALDASVVTNALLNINNKAKIL